MPLAPLNAVLHFDPQEQARSQRCFPVDSQLNPPAAVLAPLLEPVSPSPPEQATTKVVSEDATKTTNER